MLKRNSNFTLIELIVVVIVLGILAAIVIPNISSFSKEARETQYTADARNVQTALDLYTAKSDDLDGEALQTQKADPTKLNTFTAERFLTGKDADGKQVFKTIGTEVNAYGKDFDAAKDQAGAAELVLVDFDLIHPTHLRKIPKYVDRDVVVNAGALEFNDYAKKPVAAAVLMDTKTNQSTAVLQFVSGETTKAANTGVTSVPATDIAIIR